MEKVEGGEEGGLLNKSTRTSDRDGLSNTIDQGELISYEMVPPGPATTKVITSSNVDIYICSCIYI